MATKAEITGTSDFKGIRGGGSEKMGKKVDIKEIIKPAKEIIQPKEQFLTGIIKIKMTGEAKGECLVVDLEDYFERLHRQGWGCVKRQKL